MAELGSDSSCSPIGVLVADSNHMQCQLLVSALRRRPEFRVASCEPTPDDTLNAIASLPADVVILNAHKSARRGSELSFIHELHLANPQTPTILLLESSDRECVVNAFRAGARGLFNLSDHPFRLLCKCIHSVHRGQIWAENEHLKYLVDAVAQVPSLRMVNAQGTDLLTPREEQVVALVADGLTNREIAHELRLSENTIKKYLFRIFEKLGISSRVELVLYAVNHGEPCEAAWIPAAAD